MHCHHDGLGHHKTMDFVQEAPTAAMPQRIAIIGDLSGHLEPFLTALETLGVDLETARLPDDLTVVQLGDLIHKGPDSASIVAYVEGLMTSEGGRYIQLLGNHEAQYLGGPGFWRQDIDPMVEAMLTSWVSDGGAQLAVALDTVEHGQILVTHAGLTAGMWTQGLDAPADAARAATLINKMLRANPELALRPGWMLGGHNADMTAGVAWAHVTRELYMSWTLVQQRRPLPFTQVHGHSSAMWWSKRAWDPMVSEAIRERALVSFEDRHVTVPFGDHKIIGIDAGFGRQTPYRPQHPLVLTDTMSSPDPSGTQV